MLNLLKTTSLPANKITDFPRRFRQLRLPALVLLALLIFLAGFYTETIFAGLTRFYKQLFLVFGWQSLQSISRSEVSSLVTMRSFPAMATYGLGFTFLNFLFLHIFFRNSKQSKFAAFFYLSVFAACFFLICLGKLFPELTNAYKLSRRLIEFIVSPFPVVLLIAAFKAFPTKV